MKPKTARKGRFGLWVIMVAMPTQKILKAIRWLLYTAVVGTPLFYWKWSLFPYAVPKTAFFQTVVELIFALWLAVAISDKRYRPRMTPLAWAVATYLGILTLTAFTGVDPWRSFFSYLERAFGIAAYYHLAALALVLASLRNEIPWKKLWYASFSTSILIVGIALVQLGSKDFLLSGDMAGGRPGSTFGNPTFLAGYLLFNIFLAGYFALKGQKEKIFLWSVVAIDVVGIFVTATRGDILGLFAGIFALIVLFAVRPPAGRRKLYLLVMVVLLILGSGVWFTRSNAIWSHVPGIDRLKDITLSGANSDIGTRVIAAGAAWQGFLDRPLTGWGFENFNVVFNAHYDPKILEYGYAESNFDKPHSVPLEMLTAGGILAFLSYLAVFFLLGYAAWKSKDQLLGPFVGAIIVAYLVRSAVVFDTLGPAVMFYLVLAWVDGHSAVYVAAPTNDKNKKPTFSTSGGVLAAVLVPAAVVAYFFNATAFSAVARAWDGHENLQILNDSGAGIAAFEDATTVPSVYQWDLVRDYASTVAQAYFYDPASIPKPAVQAAIQAMQQVATDHPNDAYNHYLLVDVYNLAYDIDPQHYLRAAEAEAQAALALAPNRQEIYFYLIKTKNLEGDNAGALALAKKALDLDPRVGDSHFYYGMLAFANHDNAIGYQEVKAAMALGRRWHDFREPQVAADYFADSGHVSEAIELYRTALTMQPGDIEAEIKLGAAYYISGNHGLARQYLSDAASHFDFKGSPAYAQYKPILDALGIH